MSVASTSPQAARWLEDFASALARGDVDGAAGLFVPEGDGVTPFWRDFVAFERDIRTHEGTAAIRTMLAARLAATRPSGWKLEDFPAASADEAWFSFATAEGRGLGHLRLMDGCAWTLLTTLRSLHDRPEKPMAALAREPDLGVSRDPHVVIVGGGQGGIALGARLKRLGVPAVILEKNARAGDSWRKRYPSLVLHDPVWYDHLPYKPFPEGWPVFMPKDKLADWLEAYVDEFRLDYWAGAPCLGAAYDEAAGRWRVRTERDGRPLELRARHLVLATGMSGFAYVPELPGRASFTGSVLHSSGFDGGAAWRGKKCVVVGAGTSAHDICADLARHGAEATMVQRSSSIVATSESLQALAWGKLYSEAALARGITTDIADLTLASIPHRLAAPMQVPVYQEIARRDAALYEGLTRAGFLWDFGPDGSGIHTAYTRSGGGYYIEVGASRMIVDGAIRVKSGAGVARFGERSVVLADGAELPCDLVVFATGYGDMSQWASALVSPEVGARVGRVWGLGSGTKGDPGPWEGELRNMWKPTKVPGLWFFGGNLMQARHFSIYTALQLAMAG